MMNSSARQSVLVFPLIFALMNVLFQLGCTGDPKGQSGWVPVGVDSEETSKELSRAEPGRRGEPPPESTALLVAPFDTAEAAECQNRWAKDLGVPLEFDNSIGMKLVLIPPGEFLMGSPESEGDRNGNEYQHRVCITKPFYLGVYEVTQTEYERVMGTNPSAFSKNGYYSDDVKDMDTSRFPVEIVSWEEAVEFCRKLSLLTEEKAAGRMYRLPTEAEWEYACRAGTTTPFHLGSELNGSQANCNRPTTVGSYQPNAFGLYDVHGNVCEWCNDWYAKEYYRSSPEVDPQGHSEATLRVFRGGCWRLDARNCRAASRYRLEPQDRGNFLGFRVAAVPLGGQPSTSPSTSE